MNYLVMTLRCEQKKKKPKKLLKYNQLSLRVLMLLLSLNFLCSKISGKCSLVGAKHNWY